MATGHGGDDVNRELIRTQLIQTLRDVQQLGGYGDPTITDNTKPLEDLPGFDSHLAVELTSELSRKLHISIPPGENLFRAKGVARALDLGEIVDALARLGTSGPAIADTHDRLTAVEAAPATPAEP